MKLLTTLALSATIFLAACGGGGGDSESAPSPAPTPVDTTSGLYELRLAEYPTLRAFGLIVDSGVNNREIYLGVSDVSDNFYSAYLIGFGNPSAGTVTAYGYNFYGALIEYQSGPAGVYDPNSSSLTKIRNFDFNKKLSLSQVSGQWRGTVIGNQYAVLQIDSFGNFAVNVGGCVTSGTLTETGKNYLRGAFAISNSSACLTPGVSGTIVGTYHDGELTALGQSYDKKLAVGFSGTR